MGRAQSFLAPVSRKTEAFCVSFPKAISTLALVVSIEAWPNHEKIAFKGDKPDRMIWITDFSGLSFMALKGPQVDRRLFC